MIVFMPFKEIPLEFLEDKNITQVVSFNLSSYFMIGQNLTNLIPNIDYLPEDILHGSIDTTNFDTVYWNGILNNPNSFIELMSIVLPVYNQPNILVQILIRDQNNTSEYITDITESLAKLIQQRYGYSPAIINEVNDLWDLEEPTFSIPGLFNISNDLQLFISMTNSLEGLGYE